MHESSLARRILDAVLERAAAASARRVVRVRGWLAETEALSPKSLGFHFSALAKGTIAESAELELELIHIEARCKGCGAHYPCDHHLVLCPSCGSTDGEPLRETGLAIEAMEVE